jgi:hypothetical protein
MFPRSDVGLTSFEPMNSKSNSSREIKPPTFDLGALPIFIDLVFCFHSNSSTHIWVPKTILVDNDKGALLVILSFFLLLFLFL